MARPTPIGDVLAELMARHGFAGVQNARALENVWKQVVTVLEAGDVIAEHTRIAKFSRGRLEVIVDHSALLQELEFQRTTILENLTEQLPDQRIEKLRFRLGAIE